MVCLHTEKKLRLLALKNVTNSSICLVASAPHSGFLWSSDLQLGWNLWICVHSIRLRRIRRSPEGYKLVPFWQKRFLSSLSTLFSRMPKPNIRIYRISTTRNTLFPRLTPPPCHPCILKSFFFISHRWCSGSWFLAPHSLVRVRISDDVGDVGPLANFQNFEKSQKNLGLGRGRGILCSENSFRRIRRRRLERRSVIFGTDGFFCGAP